MDDTHRKLLNLSCDLNVISCLYTSINCPFAITTPCFNLSTFSEELLTYAQVSFFLEAFHCACDSCLPTRKETLQALNCEPETPVLPIYSNPLKTRAVYMLAWTGTPIRQLCAYSNKPFVVERFGMRFPSLKLTSCGEHAHQLCKNFQPMQWGSPLSLLAVTR